MCPEPSEEDSIQEVFQQEELQDGHTVDCTVRVGARVGGQCKLTPVWTVQ